MPILGIMGSSRRSAAPVSNGYVAMTNYNNRQIDAYRFNNGFVSKYANSNPAFGNQSNNVAFHPTQDYIAGVGGNPFNPRAIAWPWSGTTGFGTALAQPSLPSTTRGVGFTPNGNDVFLAGNGSPYVHAYVWSAGFGTKYANPSVLPDGNMFNLDVSPSGTNVAVTGNTGIATYAYPWSASGWGTQYASPSSTVGGGIGRAIRWSKDETAIAWTGDLNPTAVILAWSSSGFGSAFAGSPGSGGGSIGVAWSPNNDAIAFGYGNNNAGAVFSWSPSGLGTQFSNPSPFFSGNGDTVTFDSTGTVVFFGGQTINAFSFSSTGFGSKFADPAVSPGNDITGISFKSV